MILMASLTPRRITNIVVIIIGAEALAVMAGWIFGVEKLTTIAPVIRNMPFITASLFFLSALSLYCMSRVIRDEDEWARLVLPGISLIIFLVTTILLISRILGTTTGVENLFLQRPYPVLSTEDLQTAGYSPFLGMVNFLMFGVAGIASLFPGFLRKKLLTYFGITIALFGSVALVGSILNIPVLYYKLSISLVSLSLNSAASFILLGLGLAHVHRLEKDQ